MIQAAPITRFFERPAPECGIVLGKGPSLDDYDPSSANGAYVLGINNVATIIQCDGAIYSDPACNDIEYPPAVDLFRPYSQVGAHGGRGYAYAVRACRTTPWRYAHVGYVLLETGRGTGSRAVSFFGKWGVRRLRLVGCDALRGNLGYTTRVPALLKDKHASALQPYDVFAASMQRALAYYDMEWTLN